MILMINVNFLGTSWIWEDNGEMGTPVTLGSHK